MQPPGERQFVNQETEIETPRRDNGNCIERKERAIQVMQSATASNAEFFPSPHVCLCKRVVVDVSEFANESLTRMFNISLRM